MSTTSYAETSVETDPNCGFGSFEQLCSADPSDLDERGLRAALEVCRGYRARLDAAEARLIAAGDAAGAFAVGGALDAAGYLREQLGLSGREARVRLDTAGVLGELPVVAAALDAGEIGFEHARLIARATDEVHRDAIVAREHELVAEARLVPADRFKRWCARFATRQIATVA